MKLSSVFWTLQNIAGIEKDQREIQKSGFPTTNVGLQQAVMAPFTRAPGSLLNDDNLNSMNVSLRPSSWCFVVYFY